MQRLKIVDQRDIDVPFSFDRLGVTLAFNGEVYNWRDLRIGRYAWLGPWETECDAEVLAAAWRAEGPQCLQSINGMFSFVLVDHWNDEIFIARDRLGQKPLYYAQRGGRIYIGSEAKLLPIELVETPCLDADTLEYDVLESTPFRGVKRLEPGCYLRLRGPKDLSAPHPVSWWALPKHGVESGEPAALLDELEETFLDAVRIRCEAEVVTTLQFSGGLDSTLIYFACKRLGLQPLPHCVTFDEIDHLSTARTAAPGAAMAVTKVSKDAFFTALPAAIYHLDTPATWTSVCQLIMNEAVSQNGSRIVISGEGADELFGGYSRYRVLHHVEHGSFQSATADPKLVAYGPLISRAFSAPQPLVSLLDRGDTEATREHARMWLKRYGGSGPAWRRLARTETYTTMQVLLRMSDAMASAWSMENRCPFLDYRLAELASRLPSSLLLNPVENKSILRGLARRWKVPQPIVDEANKRGLAVPWAAWAPKLENSNRGAWDRKSFAELAKRTWRQVLLAEHMSCPHL